ncbi:MAG: hypothetical protein AAF693_03855 [Bacteroidota bacterium]
MKYAIFAMMLIFHLNSFSQILKVDKQDIDSDSVDYWMGSVSFDFNVNNRSTTETEEVTFRGLVAHGDLVHLSDNNAYILINTINYFRSTGGSLISTGYAHFRINFLRKKKLSYETFIQVQYDDGRRMPYRFLSGGGLRFNLNKNDEFKLHAGIGAMIETERWKSIGNESELIERNILKNSSYLSSQITFNDFVSFDLIAYYQGGYDSKSDLFRSRISGDAFLKVKVTERLSFTTNFSLQYEDRPVIPINNLIYSLTNGLKWNF